MTTLGLRPGFIELGNIAHGEQPLEHSFEQIVQVPARVLPTSVEASITLISAGHPTPAAVSDSAAADTLDETEYDTDRCPCLQSVADGLARAEPPANIDRTPNDARRRSHPAERERLVRPAQSRRKPVPVEVSEAAENGCCLAVNRISG